MVALAVSVTSSPSPFVRRFGLLQATALNMINMIGIGPFITIPLLMTALGGPQAMLGWVVGVIIAIADGKALGDPTTLADPAVVARLKANYEEEYG